MWVQLNETTSFLVTRLSNMIRLHTIYIVMYNLVLTCGIIKISLEFERAIYVFIPRQSQLAHPINFPASFDS